MPKKDQAVTGKAVTFQLPDPAGGVKLETFIPWTLVKRGVKREVITPLDAPEAFREEAAAERQSRKTRADSALVRALGLAHHWQVLLDSGKAQSPADVARLEGTDVTRVRQIFRLTLLAPDVIAGIIDIRQPRRLTLEYLLRRSIPRDWEEQRSIVQTAAVGIPERL
ncbi:MAG: hypothetical protein ACR2M4_12675 [Actinomycetota bacterium]